MNPEKFETVTFNSTDDMHGSQFLDLFSHDLPKGIEIKDPDPEGDTRRVELSHIPADEIEKVRKMIKDNGGVILEN